MSSHDVRDVLNLPADHAAGPRPSKKQRTSAPRPNLKGLAREVQRLGGDNPIAIVPEVPVFKKRRLAIRKPAVKWELKPFANSARQDDGGLVLRHWKRATDEAAPTAPAQDADAQQQPADNAEGPAAPKTDALDDSAFAKFNVQVDVPQYSDDQYMANLQNPDWTKAETDYLLALAKDFDLRWSVIWDRYDFGPSAPTPGPNDGGANALMAVPRPRSLEDLKARYYEVAHKMMAVQKPAQYMTRAELELYETMQKFNPQQEALRKQFAIQTMARSRDEAREEESLLLEVKRILARTERFNEDRRELYQRLDFPVADLDGIGPYKNSIGLATLLQKLLNADKSTKRRSIVGGPGSDGISPGGGAGPNGGAAPGSAVSETGGAHNRRESIAASLPGHRDSISGMPATPSEPASATSGHNRKKGGAQQPERRPLTEAEARLYGFSAHDRLAPGPTFRYERINKLYSHKSGQQQTRITNVLRELGIPDRLFMPTASVVAEFEQLWGRVTTLVDLRKVSDKLDMEIKLEEAKRAERERIRAEMRTGPGPERAGAGVAKSTPHKDKDADADETKPIVVAAAAATHTAAGGRELAAPASAAPADAGEKAPAGVAVPPVAAAAVPLSGTGPPAAPGSVLATNGDAAQPAAGPVPRTPAADAAEKTGGAGHKRSASVLSTTSDTSVKRQKK